MITAFTIAKGGSGKTTSAAQFAHYIADQGKRCLAIDLDPQGQLSYTLQANTNRGNVYDLLTGAPAADVIQPLKKGLDAIPASWDLSTLTTEKGSAKRLAKALLPIRAQYDCIVIDTPPNSGEMQYNAIFAADVLAFPLMATVYDLQALLMITDIVQGIRGDDLPRMGYFLTQYDRRGTITRQAAEAIEQQAKELKIESWGTIRRALAIQEAAAAQESIYSYAPRAKVTADYMELFDRITREDKKP